MNVLLIMVDVNRAVWILLVPIYVVIPVATNWQQMEKPVKVYMVKFITKY